MYVLYCEWKKITDWLIGFNIVFDSEWLYMTTIKFLHHCERWP